MKITEARKTALISAVRTIQDLLKEAYLGGEEPALKITSEGIDIDGEGSIVMESGCTPERAIERLIEDQP